MSVRMSVPSNSHITAIEAICRAPRRGEATAAVAEALLPQDNALLFRTSGFKRLEHVLVLCNSRMHQLVFFRSLPCWPYCLLAFKSVLAHPHLTIVTAMRRVPSYFEAATARAGPRAMQSGGVRCHQARHRLNGELLARPHS